MTDPTGTGTGMITELAQTTTTTYDGLANKAAAVRAEVKLTTEDVEDLHGELQGKVLDGRTTAVAQGEPGELLDRLAGEWGLSWTLVAELIGVSQTSVRKWRRGESMTPENRRAVARLVAFLEMLRDQYPVICDHASWLAMRISEESTLTPADLYAKGRVELLFDLAALRCTPQEVLSAFDPDWHSKHGSQSDFEIAKGPDGMPSIILKDRK